MALGGPETVYWRASISRGALVPAGESDENEFSVLCRVYLRLAFRDAETGVYMPEVQTPDCAGVGRR